MSSSQHKDCGICFLTRRWLKKGCGQWVTFYFLCLGQCVDIVGWVTERASVVLKSGELIHRVCVWEYVAGENRQSSQ